MKKQVLPYPATQLLPGTPSLATRYGPFLFFSTQTGYDAQEGRLVDRADLPVEVRSAIENTRIVDELEWPTTAQTWKIYDNLRRLLESQGASLDHLVRTNTFFRDLEDFPAMERTRAELLKQHPPASTVLQVPASGLRSGATVMVDGLALVPDGETPDIRKEPVRPGNVATAPAHFSVGIQAGPLVMPSGQTGYDSKTGEYIHSIAALPADAQWLATGNRHLDAREGPILAQTWATYENIRRIIAAAGCSMQDIVKETIFLRHIKHAAAVERVRRSVFPSASAAPASTIVQVSDLGRIKEALIEIDIIAVAPGTPGWQKESLLSVNGLESAGFGPVATKAGPFVFVSGQTPLDPALGRAPQSFSELPGSLKTLDLGRLAQEAPAAVQAALVYDRIDRVLRASGSSLHQALKLDLYIKNWSDIDPIRGMNALAFGSAPPAIRTMAMANVDRSESVLVKADVIACLT